jgi:hypothetical protein
MEGFQLPLSDAEVRAIAGNVLRPGDEPSYAGTLDALLKRIQEFSFAGPGASNHIPMVLIALFRMGASPDLMIRYVIRPSSVIRRTDKAGSSIARKTGGTIWGSGFAGCVGFRPVDQRVVVGRFFARSRF